VRFVSDARKVSSKPSICLAPCFSGSLFTRLEAGLYSSSYKNVYTAFCLTSTTPSPTKISLGFSVGSSAANSSPAFTRFTLNSAPLTFS
jgi:hypothetical protein